MHLSSACSRHRFLTSQWLEATWWGPHRSARLKSGRGQAGLQLTEETKREPNPVMPMPAARSTPPRRSVCPSLTWHTQCHHPCLERKAAQRCGNCTTSQELSPPPPTQIPPALTHPPPNRHRALTYRVPKLNRPYGSLET